MPEQGEESVSKGGCLGFVSTGILCLHETGLLRIGFFGNSKGGGIMFCWNRMLCRPMLWAGVAFLVSALLGSFWISFLLGGLLIALAILLH